MGTCSKPQNGSVMNTTDAPGEPGSLDKPAVKWTLRVLVVIAAPILAYFLTSYVAGFTISPNMAPPGQPEFREGTPATIFVYATLFPFTFVAFLVFGLHVVSRKPWTLSSILWSIFLPFCAVGFFWLFLYLAYHVRMF